MYIVIKTKESTVLFWESSEANWDFVLAGMSDDVHWKNPRKASYTHPTRFESFSDAKRALDLRNKRIKARVKAKDKDWTFHIIREEDLGVYLNETQGS